MCAVSVLSSSFQSSWSCPLESCSWNQSPHNGAICHDVCFHTLDTFSIIECTPYMTIVGHGVLNGATVLGRDFDGCSRWRSSIFQQHQSVLHYKQGDFCTCIPDEVLLYPQCVQFKTSCQNRMVHSKYYGMPSYHSQNMFTCVVDITASVYPTFVSV